MPSYLVEGYLARSRAAELTEAVARVRRAARTLSAEGTRVRHVRSTFLPEDELCLTRWRRSPPRHWRFAPNAHTIDA